MNEAVKKGDVVLVSFPYSNDAGQLQTKRRPALIVSSDDHNIRLEDVLVVPLISNAKGTKTAQSQVAVLMNSSEGRAGGLRLDSLIDCSIVATIPKALLVCKIGKFPEEVMTKVDKYFDQDDGGLSASVPRKPFPFDE